VCCSVTERLLRRRPARPRWAWLPATALVALLLVAPIWGGAAAAERRLEITRFAMAAEVQPDGLVRVREHLTARFTGSWNGLWRRIPLLVNRDGRIDPLGLEVLGVTDERGQPARTETSTVGRDRDLRIYVPGAVDSTRSVTLTYQVRNGLHRYRDRDVFYWNVTGNDWQVPIDEVEARIQFPATVRNLRAEVYTGPLGARERDAQITFPSSHELLVRSTRRLEPGAGLTVLAKVDRGAIASPTPSTRLRQWFQARLILLLPLITGLGLGWVWWRHGRDPRLGAVPVAYEPPEDLPPALLTSLVNQHIPSTALGATLVDVAVKGHLRIEPQQQRLLGLPVGISTRFHQLTARWTWKDLAPHEVYLLDHLFEDPQPGATVSSEDLENAFYVHVPGFERLVRDALMKKGYFLNWPSVVRALTFSLGLVSIIGLVLITLLLLPPDLSLLQMAADPLLLALCLVVSLALLVVFTWLMPRRTPRGVAVLRKALGFQQFLARVEGPRLRRIPLTADLFERYLPYAMVAGLTERWTSAFTGILLSSPSWYVSSSSDSFDIDDFSSSLNDCLNSTSSALHSSPSSSGSSSGGGGCSGGGAGGGGGGGF